MPKGKAGTTPNILSHYFKLLRTYTFTGSSVHSTPRRRSQMLGQSNQSANLVAFCRTIGLNSKNPPKLRFKKFVKLTGEIAYISLTTFENEACTMTGNKNQVNLLKLAWKRILKLHQVNLLMASFIYLGPLFAGRGSKVCNGRTLLSCLYTLSYCPK